MIRVALVGGAGFIGHNLALRLAREDSFDIHILDSLNVNNIKNVQEQSDSNINKNLDIIILNERASLLKEWSIPVLVSDAREYEILEKLEVINPDFIIHLAAVAHASRADSNPAYALEQSMRSLENSLLYCSKFNKTKIIFFSSSMVYGDFQFVPATEEHPTTPKGVYGGYKLAGESLIKAFANAYNFRYAIVRPSALYGPRCISRRIVQIFIENALREIPLIIQGDGREELDFTFIEDLTNAIVNILNYDDLSSDTFNITYGDGRSIQELANLIANRFNNVSIKHVDRNNQVPVRGQLSTNKIKKQLNFTSKYSLEEGLNIYIDWYLSLPKDLFALDSQNISSTFQINE